VVEHQQCIGEHQPRLGEPEDVRAGDGQLLEVAARLPTEVADGAAVEAGQAHHLDGLEAAELTLDLVERVAVVVVACDDAVRLGADKGVAADALATLDGPCEVLIAGNGTGRQAVNSAIGYGPGARVLAIDLSASSLAYGARMAGTLGVSNLRFAIGDILHLDESVGQFDVIECVGILHHLADPFEGWRVLIQRLRPGGLMLISLYSAVSRRIIRALAEAPDWPGPAADDDGLRDYRRTLMGRASDNDGFELTKSPDFFTKSSFRDLALHVSEQHCTIPEIGNFMAAQGLEFHGFSLSEETLRAYEAAFPDDKPPGALDNWWTFEQTN